MRQEVIEIYKFDELSEAAKRTALDNFQPVTDHIWEDARDTVKVFNNLFGTKEGINSWLDVRTGHIDDTILELTGSRLMSYLWNKYGGDLYKPAYMGSINHEVKHKRTKINDSKSGKYSMYYSGYKREYSCPLTGVCYDNDILKPIIEAMQKPSEQTFEELLKECFETLRISVENEIEYRNSDEAKTEDIEANEYEFTEDGERF